MTVMAEKEEIALFLGSVVEKVRNDSYGSFMVLLILWSILCACALQSF